MRWRMILALFLMSLVVGPAPAQNVEERSGLRTETQDRIASASNSNDLIWNLIGLLGLIGLIGLLPQHEEDSYHPSSFDE